MKIYRKAISSGKNRFSFLPVNKILKILLISFGAIIFLNLAFLDWRTINNSKIKNQKSKTIEEQFLIDDNKIATDSCGIICKQTIQEKIAEELNRLPSPAGQSSVSPPNGKPKVIYIPLVTEGNSVSTEWVDIMPSEFYFDLTNYPSAKEVRFETYLLALYGSAKVYARIYDATNFRGVDNSELSTQNNSFTRMESSAISIWRGNNKYTVQLRSANGTEVRLREAKLKILY